MFLQLILARAESLSKFNFIYNIVSILELNTLNKLGIGVAFLSINAAITFRRIKSLRAFYKVYSINKLLVIYIITYIFIPDFIISKKRFFSILSLLIAGL